MDRSVARLGRWMGARMLPLLFAAWGAALCGGCATPVAPPPPEVFHDALFGPSGERVDAAEVFAMSPAMRSYVHVQLGREAGSIGRRDALVKALYGHGTETLRLEFDAVRTRTAAEAFEARAGNCLSLVIMTAAFARELDLDVRFQAAMVEEMFTRQGDLLVGAGHVNITLGGRRSDPRIGFEEAPLTIDFMPQALLPGMRIRSIDMATVLAMYMNNRAVETMAQGRLDDAYAFAREAVRQHPGYAAGYNTLGVVYLRHGDLAEADLAFNAALARDPADARALGNLAELRLRQGLPDEAAGFRQRLARLRPSMPYLAFALGQDAMRRHDFRAARGFFQDEIARAAPDPELHYWLALADARLGDLDAAEAQLRLAQSTGPTDAQRDVYAAKLEWLQSRRTAVDESP